MNSRVDLLVIATGRYQQFLPRLLTSAAEHVSGFGTAFVFADRQLPADLNAVWLPWGHLDWPFPTLTRYRAITAYAQELGGAGTLMYVDADMAFVDTVALPGSGGLIATRHPGFVGADPSVLPYEDRMESRAFVESKPDSVYVAGGFQGGRASEYLAASAEMADWVQRDLNRGIIPKWHDESIWNSYVARHGISTLLDANYCWPEEQANDSARLLALKKNHDRVRNTPLVQRLHNRTSYLKGRIRSTAIRRARMIKAAVSSP